MCHGTFNLQVLPYLCVVARSCWPGLLGSVVTLAVTGARVYAHWGAWEVVPQIPAGSKVDFGVQRGEPSVA